MVTARWLGRNVLFNPMVKRSLIHTRSIPKLCFGAPGMMDCLPYRYFYVKYGYQHQVPDTGKFVKKLHAGWWEWADMDV